jgi:hypothetical protein
MEGNGQQKVFLNSDELMTAIVRYLNSKNVKIGPGADFKWIIVPQEGYELPPIKDISMQIDLGERR